MGWTAEQLDNGFWDVMENGHPVYRDRDDLLEVEDALRARGVREYVVILTDGTEHKRSTA